MDNQNPEHRQPLDLRFTKRTSPDTANWPVYGAFAIPGKAGTTRPMFSIEACQRFVRERLENGQITRDRAGALETAFSNLKGLAPRLTRWDRIAEHLAHEDAKTMHRLITFLSGAQPPEEGSGPARFKRCMDGKFCGCKNCAHFAPHGITLPANINARFNEIVFTPEGTVQNVEKGIECGAFLPAEVHTILEQSTTAGLCDSAATRRAQKIARVRTFPDGSQEKFYNIIFGVTDTMMRPHFEHCGDHVHLYDEMGNNILAGAESVYDANLMVDGCNAAGIFSEDDSERLLREVTDLGLPQGNEEDSLYSNPAVRVTLHMMALLGK